jgi:DNA-binding transcriptional LysR family regulator
MSWLNTKMNHFLECAKYSSFKEAAERLALTSAALSISIKKLEDEMGVELFERHPSGISLTQKGESLARLLNSKNAELLRQVEECLSATQTAPTRIGSVPHFTIRYLLSAIKAAELAPIATQLYSGFSLYILEMVKAGELDFGFIGWTNRPKGIAFQKICPDPYGYIGSKKAFPRLAKATTLDDIRQYPLIRNPKVNRDPVHYFTKEHMSYVTADYVALKHLVLGGYGVAEAQLNFFTPQELRRCTVAPVAPPDPEVDIYLVFRKDISSPRKATMEKIVEKLPRL